ncbi:TRAP transporter large permease subunit [Propionivibrio dicarboxylicus]|uniref:TRAP transporter large permease protein n=1 Tax=Propionivibrio dicarboxylicus TaxID=83767 RepID=A0A1G7W4Y5_9RHOO|nr:TRAP transporter large permease subunit [Propionivibrio dicarboxylicus]SDG67062.1 TRAP transporter, DctM subunit [Propionivibrio dicarboxylicus]
MVVTVFLISLLGAMALGMPIAFALMTCGLALMLHMDMFDAQLIAQNTIDGADNFVLMAVPFFMLAGEFMTAGGLSRRIVNLALALVGHIRGGLGYVAIVAAIIMASLSGSAAADTAAVGALLLPMMRDAGYNVPRSAGLIASSGIIAPMIPPSIPFVMFGVVAQLSITKLFMAGIVPGLMMGISIGLAWLWVIRKDKLEPAPRKSAAEVWKAVIDGIWALIMPAIILGGLKTGVFTPTEAGVVAAFYALFVGMFIYKEIKFSQLYQLLLNAGKITAVVMLLVGAAMVSSWLITVADLPGQLAAMLEPFMGNKIMLMVIVMLLVVVVGTAMDLTPTILILTPVLMPVIKQAGIDPIYFGVIFIMNNAIGLITPPVGTTLNVICGVGKVKMDDVIVGVMPFMIAELIVLTLLTLFPSLVLVPMRWFL